MRRREFISLVGAIAAWPFVTRAQQANHMRRVGIVMPYGKGDPEMEARVRAFKLELEKLGWSEHHQVEFDEHWTTDDMSLVRTHAVDLVGSKPDVVIAVGGRVVPIMMQLSTTIPIVVPGGSDPAQAGYAKTLARPGGNVTGFALFELSIFGKSLQILKQIAPGIVRVALIYNPDNPRSTIYRQVSETACGPLGIEPISAPIHEFSDIDRAINELSGDSGIFFFPDITTVALRREIVDLVARRRLPAIYFDPSFVKIGGLAFYGADRFDLFRRSASYVDRILRGEKPGDLPFEQPTKYQLTINLTAAKALGLTISPSLLVSAEEVIE
jgi:ABC-type uncharacterized transport system substrate-binding protein